MSKNPLVEQILESYKPIWALDHASSLLGWDVETYMPVQGSESRGFAQAQLALMKQERMMKLDGVMEKATNEGGLSDYEKGILRVITRDLNYFKKVPPKLIEDLHRTSTEATVVWREARKKSDYGMFKGYLEKIIELKKQEADKLGYVGHPYNALLDLYEEELTINDVDRIFSAFVPGLKKVLSKIMSEKTYLNSHPLESVEYEQQAMTRVNQETMRLLGMPEKTFRMDISTHPFTSSMSLEDVRVTTRYEGKSFRDSLYSTIHECGHAIYDLQVDPALEYTPLSRGASLGVHESQSRFWENFVGRSREFTKLVYPILKKNLQFVSGYSEEEIYKYFNVVRRSLIRVEADEVTYNFHIVVRYEMEKALIGGKVSVSDIPSLWNERMEKFLGVKPTNDAEGVLQDVHWSGGGMGYFPTYTLGNIIGGMIYDKIRKEVDLAKTIQRGEVAAIKSWLREHVHKYGATYSPKEYQTKIFGETYNPQHLLDYLEHKYLA